jgi:hypothetical protein
MSEVRIITCEACGGDRGWDVPYDIDRVHGGCLTRWVECRYCDEHGEEEIEVEPITEDDLGVAFG